MYRLSTDVGGTFTDGILLDEATGQVRASKVSSTPSNPAIGTIECLEQFEIPLAEASFLVHGTTVVINALIESKGAQTALITSQGFRDVLEIGRQNRTNMYDALYTKPTPLVPRRLRYEVKGRVDGSGKVLVPLGKEALPGLIAELKAQGIQAVAVCLINAYAAPEMEREIEEIIREHYPEVSVSTSHNITRRYYEFERTSTTVQNAYVMPVVQKYLTQLEEDLARRDYKNVLQIMQSNGGVMTSAVAREMCIGMVESGPAAGAMGAAQLAGLVGHGNIIAYDMGGTTAKAAIIVDGLPETADQYEVDGRPILLPVVDLREIGAGGGSIAWRDEAGALHVGPRSAGAEPGPACYLRGGTEPTVTDANLHLGLLNPDYFLGGNMAIDPGPAKEAIQGLAQACNLDVDEMALGIIDIVNTNMAGLLQSMTIKRGYDPRDFALVAFGGAGPIHAAAIAKELNVPTVIVPMHSGVFSAWGMLMTDLRHDFALTHISSVAQADTDEINGIMGGLETKIREIFKTENVAPEMIRVIHEVDLRYYGQEHALTIPVSDRVDAKELAAAAARFDEQHLAVYGHNGPDEPKEIVTLKVTGIGQVKKPDLMKIEAGGKEPPKEAKRGRRKVYRGQGRYADFDIYIRENLKAGNSFPGPAVVEEVTATAVVEEGQSCRVDEYGNLIITIDKERS